MRPGPRLTTTTNISSRSTNIPPSSYSSSEAGELLSPNSAGRGPRRRRSGPKQAAPLQPGSRSNKGTLKPKSTIEKKQQQQQQQPDAKPAPRKRRKRETKEELAALYVQFFNRIPVDATPEQMAQEFADKELRVILSQNGVLINDYNQETGRYTERTKIQKIEAILSMLKKNCLIPPMRLAEVQPRQKLSRATAHVGGSHEHLAAVRNHNAFQQVVQQQLLHVKEEERERTGDEDEELAPTTPATDVGAEEATDTETDVLALLSSLASGAESSSSSGGSINPDTCGASTRLESVAVSSGEGEGGMAVSSMMCDGSTQVNL